MCVKRVFTRRSAASLLAFDELTTLQEAQSPDYHCSVVENMDELARRTTEYAAEVDEANKRTLDPIIIELLRDRELK